MNTGHYVFPAIRGHQGKYDYYLAQCPLRLLPRLFLFDEAEVPKTLRRLQTLDPANVVTWTNYLSSRLNDYLLPPLVAVVDGQITFDPVMPTMPEIGQIQIPMSARLIICDGQHRRAAIQAILAEDASIGDDTIAIVLIPDPQLSRSSRIYTDLHPAQGQPTLSKRVLHDHSDLATLVRQFVHELPLFQGLTELEKTTISNRSTALFTLSAIYQATQALLAVGAKETINFEQVALAQEFWQLLGEIIPQWRQVIRGEISAAYVRHNYVHSHSVTLLAIGMAGHKLVSVYPQNWQERLKVLGELDWSRENRTLWEGRAMVRGKMSKARDSIKLTAIAIKRNLGLELTEQDLLLERSMLIS